MTNPIEHITQLPSTLVYKITEYLEIPEILAWYQSCKQYHYFTDGDQETLTHQSLDLAQPQDPMCTNSILSLNKTLGFWVSKGHYQNTCSLLNQKADPNYNEENTSLLYQAIKHSYFDVVHALLNGRADPNQSMHDNTSFLMLALSQQRNRSPEYQAVISTLIPSSDLEQRNASGQNALILACQQYDLNTIQQLIDSGSNIQTVKHHDQDMPYMISKRAKFIEIEQLLEGSMSTNPTTEQTPTSLDYKLLSCIVASTQERHPSNRYESVIEYLRQGANPNAYAGPNPIIIHALQTGKYRIAECLIEHHASPDSLTENNDSVLIATLLLCQTAQTITLIEQYIIPAMIENCKKPNIIGISGLSALMLASQYGKAHWIENLVSIKADIDLCYRGNHALKMAKNDGTRQLLLRLALNKPHTELTRPEDNKTASTRFSTSIEASSDATQETLTKPNRFGFVQRPSCLVEASGSDTTQSALALPGRFGFVERQFASLEASSLFSDQGQLEHPDNPRHLSS